MSCRTCKEEPLRGAYLRWKTANIEIIACREHWLEIRDILMVAQRKQEERYSWICSFCLCSNPISELICQNPTCREIRKKL